jgi:hypothetical protein
MAAGPMGGRRKGRLGALAFRIKRDSGELRGERAGETAFRMGVAMRHEVRLSKPKRIIRIVCGRVSAEGGGEDGKDALVQKRTLSPPNAAVSYRGCTSASWHQRRMRSTMPTRLDVFIVFIA